MKRIKKGHKREHRAATEQNEAWDHSHCLIREF